MIPNPIQASGLLPVGATPALLRTWTLGQVLTALVVAEPVAGRTTLRIGAQTIQADTALPLTPGQTLALKVTDLGRQPVLTLVANATPGADPGPQQSAMRFALPRQAPLPPLLETVRTLLSAPSSTQSLLPAPVVAALTEWVAQLPAFDELANPAGLKSAIDNSGLFLEARLAGGNTPPGALDRDLKNGLLRLVSALADSSAGAPPEPPDAPDPPALQNPPPPAAASPQPAASTPAGPAVPAALPAPAPAATHAGQTAAPGSGKAAGAADAAVATRIVPARDDAASLKDLARQATAALARIETSQLQQLPGADRLQPVWTFELPVRDRQGLDLLQLRVEAQDRRQAGRLEQEWSLTLATDFPGLGPVHARVRLSGNDAIRTTLWAERPDTLQLMQMHRDWLHRQIEASGLKSVDITCLAGRPVAPAQPRSGPLVDLSV